jgi:hypothetical protein
MAKDDKQLEELRALPLSELKARKEAAAAELERLSKGNALVHKRIMSTRRQAQGMVEYADKQLKAALSESNPTTRERLTRLNELRRQAALTNLEMLELLANSDWLKPIPQEVMDSIDVLSLRTGYLATEYNLMVFQRFSRAVGAGLSKDEAPDATGKPGTGALAQGPQTPGIPRGGSAAPGRPGIPAAGQMAAGGPRALPGRPTPGAAPGARPVPAAPGAARPSLSRTGPLPGSGAAPLRPGMGSGPLNRTNTGPLGAAKSAGNSDEALVAEIRAASADPATKQKLMILASRVEELEQYMMPLRGDQTGSLAMDLFQATPYMKQIASKVYYINRSLSELGGLGDKMPFDNGTPDPKFTEMLTAMLATEDEPQAAARTDSAPQDLSISQRLKSLFKP